MSSLRRGRRIGVAAVVAAIVAGCSLVPSPSAPVAPAGPGPVVNVAAIAVAWQPIRLDLPNGLPSTIVVDNQDQGVPHGLVVRRMDDQGVVFEGEIVTGPSSTRYVLPPFAAGAYEFACPVHPSMTGQLFVR